MKKIINDGIFMLDRRIDLKWRRRQSIATKLLLWVFRKRINLICLRVINRAYESGLIGSKLMHELVGIKDMMLYPEYWRSKSL